MNEFVIKSVQMPEFVRVVEFEIGGKAYNAELILTRHSLEFYVYQDNQKLSYDQSVNLFGSNDNEFNEVIDLFMEKVEDLEADAIISWREKVSK